MGKLPQTTLRDGKNNLLGNQSRGTFMRNHPPIRRYPGTENEKRGDSLDYNHECTIWLQNEPIRGYKIITPVIFTNGQSALL